MPWDSEQRFWPQAEAHHLEIKSSNKFDVIYPSGNSSQDPGSLQVLKSARLLLFEASVMLDVCVCARVRETSAALSVFLQDVSARAGAQVPSLCVLADEVTRLWCLNALIHVWKERARHKG